MKRILLYILVVSVSFSGLGQIKNSTSDNSQKNFIGIKSLGSILVGNVALQYMRTIFQKGKYSINLETDFIYGYKVWRYTNNFGGSFSINGGKRWKNNSLIIGLGGCYLLSPEVNNNPENSFYSSTGINESKQTVNLFLRIGWKYQISNHWTIRLAYDPGLTYREQWRFSNSLTSYDYKWYVRQQVLFFEFSILYHF